MPVFFVYAVGNITSSYRMPSCISSPVPSQLAFSSASGVLARPSQFSLFLVNTWRMRPIHQKTTTPFSSEEHCDFYPPECTAFPNPSSCRRQDSAEMAAYPEGYHVSKRWSRQ